MIRWIGNLIENKKLVRRLLVLWAVVLITFVTLEIAAVLGKMTEITAPVTSFYLGVTALLTAVIGFYQWGREKDDATRKHRHDRED